MQRIVLDTNVLVSSLLNKQSKPYLLYRAWDERKYILVTSPEQLEELELISASRVLVRSQRGDPCLQ